MLGKRAKNGIKVAVLCNTVSLLVILGQKWLIYGRFMPSTNPESSEALNVTCSNWKNKSYHRCNGSY